MPWTNERRVGISRRSSFPSGRSIAAKRIELICCRRRKAFRYERFIALRPTFLSVFHNHRCVENELKYLGLCSHLICLVNLGSRRTGLDRGVGRLSTLVTVPKERICDSKAKPSRIKHLVHFSRPDIQNIVLVKGYPPTMA